MFQNIFSDQTEFNRDEPDGIAYYWRDLRMEQRYFSERNFARGGLMIWAAFDARGKLQLAFTTSKI